MVWKRALLAIAVVLALAAIWSGVSRHIPSSVDYRGEKIKLVKYYLDYDGYKNDPDNIDPSQTARVQRLVSQAQIDYSFLDLHAAVAAVFQVKFPGYGSGGFGSRKADGDAELSGFEVEIPRSENGRYFIFRTTSARSVLLDDFIALGPLNLADFHRDGNNLVYTTETGQPKLVRSIDIFK